jgi:hypothetical protein
LEFILVTDIPFFHFSNAHGRNNLFKKLLKFHGKGLMKNY